MKEIPYESGSCYIFDRAYNNFKMLYKVHQIDAFFVVRAKKNLQYKSIKWKRRLPKNVLSDVTIELIGFYPKQYYPEQFRLVRYLDEEQKREFVFLTNAMHISALQVAELYKNRWQVELFFKWLKQHLKIKKFWGTTENEMLFGFKSIQPHAPTAWWQSFNTIYNWIEVNTKLFKYQSFR